MTGADNNRNQLRTEHPSTSAGYDPIAGPGSSPETTAHVVMEASDLGGGASTVTASPGTSMPPADAEGAGTAAQPNRSPRLRLPGMDHTFESFRYRNYRFVWATTFFSSAGFWLQQIVVGWLMYDITKSAFLTTLAMGLDALPILLVGPVGGLLVDSWDRRKLLAGIYAYQTTVSSVFAAIVITGHAGPWHIFCFILMMGMGWVILDPARASLVSTTVPGETLVNAFALNSLGFSVTRLAAPAVGGGLLALFGPGPALVIEAGLQFAAAMAALAIRLPPVQRAELRLRTAFSRLLEGARYVLGQKVILSVVALSIVPPMMSFPFLNGLMPVFAAEVFGTGSVGLGLLMSSLGAGSVMGTLVLASFRNVQRKGRLIILSVGLTSLTMLTFSQVTSLYLAFPVLIVSSVGMMVFFSTASALVQSIVPDEFRGRVTSISMLAFGTMPLGSLIAGAIAQRLGAPTAMLIAAGAVAFVLGVFLMRTRLLWRSS